MGISPFFLGKVKMLNRGLDKLELLRIVEAVANENLLIKNLSWVYGRRYSKAALTNSYDIYELYDREVVNKIQKFRIVKSRRYS